MLDGWEVCSCMITPSIWGSEFVAVPLHFIKEDEIKDNLEGFVLRLFEGATWKVYGLGWLWGGCDKELQH